MNLNNFTIKAAEVIQQAQQLAYNQRNPNIENEHLLKALLKMEDSPVEYLLKKNNVTINLVESKLEEMLKKLPTTTGESAQSIGRDANAVILRSGAVLKQFGDEFVTRTYPAGYTARQRYNSKILQDAGAYRKRLSCIHQRIEERLNSHIPNAGNTI